MFTIFPTPYQETSLFVQKESGGLERMKKTSKVAAAGEYEAELKIPNAGWLCKCQWGIVYYVPFLPVSAGMRPQPFNETLSKC